MPATAHVPILAQVPVANVASEQVEELDALAPALLAPVQAHHAALARAFQAAAVTAMVTANSPIKIRRFIISV